MVWIKAKDRVSMDLKSCNQGQHLESGERDGIDIYKLRKQHCPDRQIFEAVGIS